MKHIVKNESPTKFEDWKIANKPTKWSDFLSNPPQYTEDGIVYYSRYELKEEILREQYSLCCYCNDILKNDYKTEIEHLEPREGDTNTERIFDYNNLLASCIGGRSEKTSPKILYCNAHKGKETLELTPLMPECEIEIYYTDQGGIFSDIDRGKRSIRVLNLDNKILKNRREAAIESRIYADIENRILLSNEELVTELQSIENHKSVPFYQAIVYNIKGLI